MPPREKHRDVRLLLTTPLPPLKELREASPTTHPSIAQQKTKTLTDGAVSHEKKSALATHTQRKLGNS